ncbi:bifunctional folylpolyglutamate synthase/dihydrofolate synthase, partial [Candidatus Woesearchaeota archaeon]|nr:bifunctional folylpolyglutamate synthase/dihydrofolate synthase [Candidatus Woesearchaeota archaeon]
MQEVLDYLYGLKKFGSKLRLEEMEKLVSVLDHPQKKFKSIHIAGTNGKGSTSAFLAQILQEAGYKVGLYTSPHLVNFNERIKINGK